MPFVTQGDRVGVPDTNLAVVSSSVDVFDTDGLNIGFMQQITRTDTRQVTRIRHLDSFDAGRIVEQVPMPEDLSLNVMGFALYNRGSDKQSLINRIGGSGSARFKSLNSQQIPFNLLEEWTHPANPNNRGQTYYLGCWLTNYSRPINIGTVTVAETATIQPSWVDG